MIDWTTWVERMQEAAYGRVGQAPPSHRQEDVEAWVSLLEKASLEYEATPADGRNAARQMNKYRLAYRRRPPLSRYEIIQYYLTLAVRLESAIAFYKAEADGQVDIDFGAIRLATIPSVEPNAAVFRTPDRDDVLMLFNVGLIPMIAAAARFVSHYGDLETLAQGGLAHRLDRATATRNIRRDPSVMNDLFAVLDAQLFGTLENLPLDFARPPLPKGRIYQLYFSTMADFVVGHEMAHIALQHLGGARAAHDGESAEQVELSHQQEFEADTLGVIYAQIAQAELARQGGVENKSTREFAGLLQAFYGSDMLLRLFELLENACIERLGITSVAAQGGSRTHPPCADRLKLIHDVTLDRCAEAQGYVDNASEIAADLLVLLRAEYATHLDQPGFRGLRPTAMWRAAFGGT